MTSVVAVSLWATPRPIPRTPFLVCNRGDPDRLIEFDVINRVRKAPKSTFPGTLIIQGSGRLGTSPNLLKDSLQLQSKLATESLSMAFVIGGCGSSFRLGLEMDHEWFQG